MRVHSFPCSFVWFSVGLKFTVTLSYSLTSSQNRCQLHAVHTANWTWLRKSIKWLTPDRGFRGPRRGSESSFLIHLLVCGRREPKPWSSTRRRTSCRVPCLKERARARPNAWKSSRPCAACRPSCSAATACRGISAGCWPSVPTVRGRWSRRAQWPSTKWSNRMANYARRPRGVGRWAGSGSSAWAWCLAPWRPGSSWSANWAGWVPANSKVGTQFSYVTRERWPSKAGSVLGL